jgi:hypothetical protein
VNEPVHGLGHIAEPGTTAHFTVSVNIYAGIALMPESIANRIVFGRAEFFSGKAAFAARSSRGEKRGWAQQTTDLFGADQWFHRSDNSTAECSREIPRFLNEVL